MGSESFNGFFHPGITQGLLPGANGGINFRYMEENHFGFIVELNFEQRGWKEGFRKASVLLQPHG